jgi:hypothetical protein
MIPEIDIWRAAGELIKQFRGEVDIEPRRAPTSVRTGAISKVSECGSTS